MKQRKIFGEPWKGKKSKSGQFGVILKSSGNKSILQVLKPIRNEIGEDRYLVVFGVEEKYIYLNFLTPKEDNNYDTYKVSHSGSIACGAFIRDVELADGFYPVEKVAPGVYRIERRVVK